MLLLVVVTTTFTFGEVAGEVVLESPSDVGFRVVFVVDVFRT